MNKNQDTKTREDNKPSLIYGIQYVTPHQTRVTRAYFFLKNVLNTAAIFIITLSLPCTYTNSRISSGT
jgi:hypothetical protein